MCAALSSYARACAAKGVMLWGWRERVCSECFPTGCFLRWPSGQDSMGWEPWAPSVQGGGQLPVAATWLLLEAAESPDFLGSLLAARSRVLRRRAMD